MTVTLIDHMGSDVSVAKSAWVSTGSDDRDASPASVERLIRTLLGSRPVHSAPFGHPHLTVLVECPIFVSREWFRHRSWASYSEISTRYVDMAGDAYLPPVEDMRAQAGKRIGYQMEPLAPDQAALARVHMDNAYNIAHDRYQRLLDLGVAREVARNVLPLGTMTRFYGTVSLRNALGFLTLRNHPAALLEIRREAESLEAILFDLFPITVRVWSEEGRPPV